MLFELKRLEQDKPVEKYGFNPERKYFAEGYTLEFSGIWKLLFNKKVIITETDKNFWSIVDMYDYKPFKVSDTTGEDFKPWEPDLAEEDKNFIPSLCMDYGTGEKVERPFPIWEWNEYVPTGQKKFAIA